MDSRLILCGLLALAGLSQAKIDMAKVEKEFNACRMEIGAEETFESVIKDERVPTSDKGMCLVECLLRTKGIYDGEGKYHPEGSQKWLEEKYDDDEGKKKTAMEIVKECSEIDIEGLDKCEAAVKHVTCAKAKGVQRNLKLAN